MNGEEETLCRVIEGGFNTGLNTVSVIIEGDSLQQKREFPNHLVKPYVSNSFKNLKVNSSLLSQCIIRLDE
jgi:hypothetical protein